MGKFRRVLASMLLVLMVFCQGFTISATDTSGSGGLNTLVSEASNAKASATYGTWNYENKHYKCADGGYLLYTDLAKANVGAPINESALSQLTTGAKSDFLTDYYNAGMEVVNHNAQDNITEEVGTNWLELVQNTSGVGSQLMTTLMSQTKPDFVTANRIYAPFSGTVGTILGVISILIMAFLALTMVLDIAYIAIPAFQLFVDGDGEGGQGGGKKKSFISSEARDAVQMAEGGQGGGGQNGGSNKLAISIYFKKRVLMLVVLGICLLYLVSGNIFALVGMIIDLLSGFLGF